MGGPTGSACGPPGDLTRFLFSYQVIVWVAADRTSRSPSPSTSAAYTLLAPIDVLIIWAVKFWLPSFSYQAILELDAERTSVSPSPSTSAAYTLWVASRLPILWPIKFWLPSFSNQAILRG